MGAKWVGVGEMIPDLLSSLLGFLLDKGLYALAFFVVIVVWRLMTHASLITNPNNYPKSLPKYRKAIRVERWGRRYLFGLRSLNNWLTGLIGDQYRFPKKPPPRQAFWPYLKSNNPWTVESYEFCLKLALIYPIISVAFAWILGGNGRFGDQIIYAADVEWFWRVAYGASLAVVAGLVWWSTKLAGWKLGVALTCAAALAIVGAIATIDISTSAAAFTFTVVFASASPVVFASVSTIILAETSTFFFAFAVALVVISAAIGIFTASSAIMVASIVGITVFIAIPVTIAFLIYRFNKKVWQESGLLIFWVSFTILIFSSTLIGFTRLNSDPLAITILLFFGLLPLANTLPDWLSLGVTRHLLQRLQVDHGVAHAVLWATADLLLALVFLFLISMVLVSVVSLANLFALKPVLDLQAVFASLRDVSDHKSDFWVYFMLLSTLLPTLVHFALVGGALTRAIPRDFRHKLVNGIGKDEQLTWYAYLYLVFTPAVGFVLAPALLLSLLWWVVSTHGGVIGFGLLDVAEWVGVAIDPTLGHVHG